jgi:hypothetical protein
MKEPTITEQQDVLNHAVHYTLSIPMLWMLEARNERWYKLKLMLWLFRLIWESDKGLIGKVARYRRAFPAKVHP